MKKNILYCALIIFSVSCSTINIEPLQSEFNYKTFCGTVSKDISKYEDVILDSELTGKDGKNIYFDRCSQIDLIDEDDIKTSQYHIYKSIKLKCKAIKLYIEKGAHAKRTFFPKKITKAFIESLPATIGPVISEHLLSMRNGKTLAEYELSEYESSLDISIIDKFEAKVVTKVYQTTFKIMARADFNNDGVEDLLARISWKVREAFGKGSDLFILEKKSTDEPILLTWRYTKI